MSIGDKLIVALDVKDEASAKDAFQKLQGTVSVVKIGLELYTQEGREIVKRAVGEGFKVFLDLKFHDIPNTVAKAIEQVADLGAFMTNVHTLGGLPMMQKAKEALEGKQLGDKQPLLIGVTVLTSHDEESFTRDLGVTGTIQDSVLRFASLAKRAGLDGVVASPQELELIKKNLGQDFKVVTPGVRPEWASKGDQKRVMTPGEAISKGADYIVVGRPIMAASNIKDAAKKVIDEMEAGK
jgi:orotidine-5'-phosphate decarboxylase